MGHSANAAIIKELLFTGTRADSIAKEKIRTMKKPDPCRRGVKEGKP